MTSLIQKQRQSTRRLAYSIVLAALGLALSPISIPTGIAKISPTQHLINVLAAVLVGPWWGLAIAFVMALVRNLLGTGTPLAFPGSMIGVLLAGLLYQRWRNDWLAVLGEVVGTGLIGATVAALLVAPLAMGKSPALIAMLTPFAISALVGAVLALASLGLLRKAHLLPADE